MKMKKKQKEVLIRKKDKYSDYIMKDSVEKLGAVSIEDECVMTRDGDRYYVYRFYFETPIGIDENINLTNKGYLHDMINSLEHSFKVLFPSESKNMMNETIVYYQKLLETEISEKRKRMIAQEIEEMKLFNEGKSINTILFIHSDDDDMLHKAAMGIILEKLGQREIEKLFSMLNNRME